MVAIGDIHGHESQMIELLGGLALIDGELDWTGGADHLVLMGDLVDRGSGDRAVLDLARKLQMQAEEVGGRVHVVLGNHEVMNLSGNFDYVTAESFAAFADEETREERRRALRAFRRSLSTRGLGRAELVAAFDDRFPPGYFGWSRAFAPDGEYGAWLIEQPTVVVINDRVFVHGGLTEEVAALGVEEINRRMRSSLLAFDDYDRQIESEWPHAYSDTMSAARRLARERGRRSRRGSRGVRTAADRLLEESQGLPFATDGPVWYRGSAIENERIEERQIDRVLELLEARSLVIAHTPTRSGDVTSRFNRRLYRTDVGMGYGRPGEALVFDDGTVGRFLPSYESIANINAEAPQGEGWPQGEEELPDDVLERFLTRARITSNDPADFGIPVRLLELESAGMHLRAVFGYAQETRQDAAAEGRSVPRRFQNTIAAYRVDRMMQLGRVPVTVPRRIDGKRGLVQIWLEGAWDLELIEEYNAWNYLEGLETEMAEAAAFSALIGLVERVPAGQMFLLASRRIALADNSVSFPESSAVEPYLPEGCGPVSAGFLAALRSLERRELIEELDDLVSVDAIDALLARRNKLVELCERPAPDWSLDKFRERVTGEIATTDDGR